MHFGLGKEALSATLGGETIPDLKETLDFGPGFFGDRWPMRPPDLEPVWRGYYEAMWPTRSEKARPTERKPLSEERLDI